MAQFRTFRFGVIRGILGMQKRREVSAAELERLKAFAFPKRPHHEGTLEQNIALGDRPVPDSHPGSKANILPGSAPAAGLPVQRPKRPPWW
jgi:hypothetical protein